MAVRGHQPRVHLLRWPHAFDRWQPVTGPRSSMAAPSWNCFRHPPIQTREDTTSASAGRSAADSGCGRAISQEGVLCPASPPFPTTRQHSHRQRDTVHGVAPLLHCPLTNWRNYAHNSTNMYVEYFALKEFPFLSSPDARYLYLSDQVNET